MWGRLKLATFFCGITAAAIAEPVAGLASVARLKVNESTIGPGPTFYCRSARCSGNTPSIQVSNGYPKTNARRKTRIFISIEAGLIIAQVLRSRYINRIMGLIKTPQSSSNHYDPSLRLTASLLSGLISTLLYRPAVNEGKGCNPLR